MLDPGTAPTEAVLVTDTTTTTEGTTTMSTSTLAYSSSTGTGTTYLAPELDTTPGPTVWDEYWDEYCFVCGRCTDHVGEHEDLVAAGMAEYEGGTVRKTDAYDTDRAREIADRGFIAYMAGPDAYEAFCRALEEARA